MSPTAHTTTIGRTKATAAAMTAVLCALVGLCGCGLQAGGGAIRLSADGPGRSVETPLATPTASVETAQSGQGNLAATLQTLLDNPQVQAGVANLAQHFATSLSATLQAQLQTSVTAKTTQGDDSSSNTSGWQIFGQGDSATTIGLLVILGIAVLGLIALVGGAGYAFIFRFFGWRMNTPQERKAKSELRNEAPTRPTYYRSMTGKSEPP